VALGLYLAVGLAVSLRAVWSPDPRLAADAYLKALQERDPVGIYLLSTRLGARLAGMMAGADVPPAQRQELWAQDLARFRSELEKGGDSQDGLRRERALISPGVQIEPVQSADFRAVVQGEEGEDLVRYADVPGRIHHLFYRLRFPEDARAPPAALLDTKVIRFKPKKGPDRLRAVVVRVEVSRRPEVKPPRSWLLDLPWLAALEPAFPWIPMLAAARPEDIWSADLSFEVDPKLLELR
jgi:hypothetical protein